MTQPVMSLVEEIDVQACRSLPCSQPVFKMRELPQRHAMISNGCAVVQMLFMP